MTLIMKGGYLMWYVVGFFGTLAVIVTLDHILSAETA